MSYSQVGDRVRIKPTMSANGKYGAYLGMEGKITYSYYGDSNTIKLDDGTELTYVGRGAFINLTKGEGMTMREKLIQSTERLTKTIADNKRRLSLLDKLGVDDMTAAEEQAVGVIVGMGLEVTEENLANVAELL